MTTLKHDTKPSVEDLLAPRYMLIESYPANYYFKVGDILTQSDQIPMGTFGKFINETTGWAWVHHPEKYKANLKRLEWWEERQPEEMPEYVKHAGSGRVAKVSRFDLKTTSAWFMYLDGELQPYAPGGSALENTHWLPATLEEYLSYTSPTKNGD